MQPIVLNGLRITSNKKVAGIINGLIIYLNGSWANTRTGQIYDATGFGGIDFVRTASRWLHELCGMCQAYAEDPHNSQRIQFSGHATPITDPADAIITGFSPEAPAAYAALDRLLG